MVIHILDNDEQYKAKYKNHVVSYSSCFCHWCHISNNFHLFKAKGVDSGYSGGKPGYVSGNKIIAWIMDRFHIVIIGTVFSCSAFLIVLALKVHQLITRNDR